MKLDLNDINNKRFAVALSGGRDSIALLHLFKNAGVDFFAVNIEHGIRGENSLSDTEFCKNICKEWNIPIEVYSIDSLAYSKENKITVEQAARELRYKIFDELVHSGKCDYIALAHHTDDQIETMLMRILRGTGIKGLIGMKRVSGHYFRPLLEYDRTDIDEYIKENNLEYVEDETNSDTQYTRNFLRKEIKVLKEKYPNLKNSFLRLQRNAEESEEYIEKQVPKFEVRGNERFISFDAFKEKALAKRAIVNAINDLSVLQDIEEKHLDLVLDLKNNKNGSMLNLTHNVICVKEETGVVFYLDNKKISFTERPFSIQNLKDLGYELEVVESNKISKEKVLNIDLDKLTSDCVIRTRKDLDYINKFGGGSKSLGDYFTDNKVPKRLRDNIPLIARGNEVLVILGYEISSNVKVDESTKRILKIKK